MAYPDDPAASGLARRLDVSMWKQGTETCPVRGNPSAKEAGRPHDGSRFFFH